MKILDFFLFLWVIFALLDPIRICNLNAGPDPDPANQNNADPDPDTDPKPWSEVASYQVSQS
jgi:hypothetical protein